MSLNKDSFGKAAGSGKASYLALDSIFRGDPPLRDGWQTHKDRYEELQARKWLLESEEEAAPIVAAMKEHLRRQVGILHDPRHDVAGLLAGAQAEIAGLDEWERGNLRRMQHIYTHQSGFLKPGLIDRYEQVLADAEHDWAATLDSEDPAQAFAAQIAPMESAIAVIRESAQEPARRMGVKLSEAALDLLNPGMTNDAIDAALAQLKAGYPALIAQIRAQDKKTPAPLDAPEMPAIVQQRVFNRIKDEMLCAAGWTPEKLAAADITLSPLRSTATGFCWGSNKDITLSVETYEDGFYLGIGNTWHEVGHLLYVLHMSTLPPQAQGRPVGQFNGFGAHETAAMFMEQAGLRLKAMELVEPIVREELAKARAEGLLPASFDVNDPAFTAANMHALANRPKLDNMEWGTSELALAPNMAWRTLALRKLIDGEMNVAALPQFWARTMKEWTGIDHDPAQFQIGESHVFEGLGGYFWAYMTGAFCAAQLQRQIAPTAAVYDRKLGPEATLADYIAPYSDLLQSRLFSQGSKRPALETLRAAMNGGDPNDPSAFMARIACAAEPGMPTPDTAMAAAGSDLRKPRPRAEPLQPL